MAEDSADLDQSGGSKAKGRACRCPGKVHPIAGTPDECIAAIEEYKAAGCTHILLEIWGDNRTEQARLFGEAVLPHFKKVAAKI